MICLGVAAQSGHVEMVRGLLARGAGVNTPDFYGQTALHFAAEFGQELVAEILIAAGELERNIVVCVGFEELF